MKTKAAMVAGIIDDLRRIFQAVIEQSKRAEQETGLTGSQLWAVKILAKSEPVKVTELAQQMYLHPATVVGVLDRLESKGLVARTRSSKDRRVVYVELSEAGRTMVSSSPEVAQRLLVKGLEALKMPKVELIAEGLEELSKMLGVQDMPPRLILSTEVNMPRRSRTRVARAAEESAG